MRFARRVLESLRRIGLTIRQRVVSTARTVRDNVNRLRRRRPTTTTTASIDDEQVHRPLPVNIDDLPSIVITPPAIENDVVLESEAMEGKWKNYYIEAQGAFDPVLFLESVRSKIISQIFRSETNAYISLDCVMKKIDPENNKETLDSSNFRSCVHIIELEDSEEIYDEMVAKVMSSFAEYQKKGSGWILESLTGLRIIVSPSRPMGGGSYIPLPKDLKGKGALINLKNKDDDYCLMWSITRANHPVDSHPERITNALREQTKQYDWTGISFPATMRDIKIFEKNNNMSISIVALDGCRIYPIRRSKFRSEIYIILMLFTDDQLNTHYTVVKNLSRLLKGQTTSKHAKRYYCINCFNGFTSEMRLAEHREYCDNEDCVKTILPTPGNNILNFKNSRNGVDHPFTIYADFECLTKPLDYCEGDASSSYTIKYQKHEPSGYCFYTACSIANVYDKPPVLYTLESEFDNVTEHFVLALCKTAKEIRELYNTPLRLESTKTQGTHCHVCNKPFTEDEVRVFDKCKFTQRSLGIAHRKCAGGVPKFIPVIFHNLEGYDCHLFIRDLAKVGKVKCIAKNAEKYISFSCTIDVGVYIDDDGITHSITQELRFLDSFGFMSSGLTSLVGNLDKKKDIKITNKFYEGKSLDLLLRKGVYPYDYMSGFDKLSETKLPVFEDFYSKLNGENISKEDYKHAQNVWDHFDCKTMRNYHDLYLKSDVLLLADVFENFKVICMKNYNLDPVHYYTSPGLAWDACLKKTDIKLELLTDPDKHLMFEKGSRGGVSTISHRHSLANNKYMENYDPSKESKYIMYLDANNLYGYAMSQPLPTGGFEWMSQDEMDEWRDIPCILEVDLEYPTELHDLHNEYPLAPEKMTIGKVEKLVPNLNNKTKYVVHHTSLKLYTSLGLKITKIH